MKRITLSNSNAKIAGVCGGIAEYFSIDPTVVRLATALLALFTGGIVVLAYVLAWLILPKSDDLV